MIFGIEIGGTFTDLILIADGERRYTHKLPSTPRDPSQAAITGFSVLTERAGVDSSEVTDLLHGSTISTNTLIERKGANTGLITTAGFEDIPRIARGDRTEIYDFFYQHPEPAVNRTHIRGVTERLDAQGNVVVPLDEAELEQVIDTLVGKLGITSLAVCLLHAYRNPIHEQVVADLLGRKHPELPVTLSSTVSPEFREYERTSTTVISAYVQPAVVRYLKTMERNLSDRGFRGELLIMQSNGGVVPVASARAHPAKMLLSGPAAGVTGAVYLSQECAIPNLITFDVGGTSCDMSLVTNHEPHMTAKGLSEHKVSGLALNLPMMDIVTLGAGGGSIARIDGGGMMQVGPESAGADPGPACYGLGGGDFTLTDAMVLMGLIDPGSFLGGTMSLDSDAAARAATPMCKEFSMSVTEVAQSTYRIAVANIAQILRLATVKRGYDPRDYGLFAYGGAGPMLAASVAEETDIAHVVVPPDPGIFSAYGLSVADVRMDHVQSVPGWRVTDTGSGAIAAVFDDLRHKATSEFASLGTGIKSLAFSHSVDARYVGQGHELRVLVDPEALAGKGGDHIAEGFHGAHEQRYGHGFPHQEVELINFRLTTVNPRRHTPLRAQEPIRGPAPEERMLTFTGDPETWRVLSRESLGPGSTVEGPALIVEPTSGVVIPRGWTASMDTYGVVHLRRGGEQQGKPVP